MRRHLLLPFLLVGLLTIAACGDSEGAPSADDPAPAAPADDVIGHSYQGESIVVDGDAIPVPGGGTLEITFAGPDGPAAGTLRAHATCNSFGGPYTLDGDQLAVRTERWERGTLLSLLGAGGQGAVFAPQDAAEG